MRNRVRHEIPADASGRVYLTLECPTPTEPATLTVGTLSKVADTCGITLTVTTSDNDAHSLRFIGWVNVDPSRGIAVNAVVSLEDILAAVLCRRPDLRMPNKEN